MMRRPTGYGTCDSGFVLTLVLFVFLMFPGASLYPATNFELDVIPGFSGWVKPNHWVPFRVTLSNEGSHIKGAIQLDLGYGSEESGTVRTVTFARDLDLPPRSRKTFSFVVFVESLFQPVWLRVFDGNSQIANMKIDLRSHGVYERLVVALSRDISLDFLSRPEGASVAGLAGSSSELPIESRFRVVYPLAEHIPDRWNGYDSIDVLVIHDIPLHHLSFQQIGAIEKWVALGGTVVLAGGSHLTPESAAQLKPIMPAEVLGFKGVANLRALEKLYGSGISAFGRSLVTNLRPTSGTVLLEQGGVPLIIEEKRGKGRIVLFAFDYSAPPLDKWPGKYRLWQETLGSRSSSGVLPAEGATLLSERTPAPALVDAMSLSFPSHLVLLGFLGLIVGTLSLLIRLRGSRFTVILSTGLASAVFSLGGYLVFHSWLFKSETAAVEVSLLSTSPGQEYGLLRKDLLLISTRDMLSSIALHGNELSVVPGAGYDMTVREHKEVTGLVLPMDRWVPRFCRIYSVVEFPFSGAITTDGTIVRIYLTNETSHVLRDALLIFESFPRFIGDLGPGESMEEICLSGANTAALEAPRWGDMVPSGGEDADLKRELLMHLLQNGEFTDTLEERAFVLAGWLEEDCLPVEDSPRFLKTTRLVLVTVAGSTQGAFDAEL